MLRVEVVYSPLLLKFSLIIVSVCVFDQLTLCISTYIISTVVTIRKKNEPSLPLIFLLHLYILCAHIQQHFTRPSSHIYMNIIFKRKKKRIKRNKFGQGYFAFVKMGRGSNFEYIFFYIQGMAEVPVYLNFRSCIVNPVNMSIIRTLERVNLSGVLYS